MSPFAEISHSRLGMARPLDDALPAPPRNTAEMHHFLAAHCQVLRANGPDQTPLRPLTQGGRPAANDEEQVVPLQPLDGRQSTDLML